MIQVTFDGECAKSILHDMARFIAGYQPQAVVSEVATDKGDPNLYVNATEAMIAAADEASFPAPISVAPAEKKTRKRRTKVAEPAAISSGEERVGPEDSPETQAADAADEQAESDAAKADNPAVTHDDVRGALGAYVKTYGMAAAQEDGPKLLALAFPGKGVVKISDIPDDQASLKSALAGVNEMTAKNPYERAAVA